MTRVGTLFSPAAGPAVRARRAAAAAMIVLGAASFATPAARAADLSVQGAWFRIVVPTRPAAGYFRLRNDSDAARTLVGAQSAACGSLMMHQSLHQGGEDRMVMVRNLPVPAHGSLVFGPGGYHLMCVSPGAAVRPGNSVPVTLRFADGSTIEAPFAVKGAVPQ